MIPVPAKKVYNYQETIVMPLEQLCIKTFDNADLRDITI